MNAKNILEESPVKDITTDAYHLAREKANHLAESIKETAMDAVEEVRARTGAVADSTRAAIEKSQHVARDEYDRALAFVRRNPVASLSVVAFAGLVLGTWLTNKIR